MKLFISYAHDDEFLVRTQIVDVLRSGGHEPWFDHALIPGKDWQLQLLEAIIACEAFVYAMTPRSLESEWCRWEYEQAVKMSKRVMPVLLVNAIIPPELGTIQYVDFTQGATGHPVAKLMNGLQVIDRSRVQALPATPAGAPAQAVPNNWEEIEQLRAELRAAQEQIRHLHDNRVDKSQLEALKREVMQRDAQIRKIERDLEVERLRNASAPPKRQPIPSQPKPTSQPIIAPLRAFNPLDWLRLYRWLFFNPGGLLEHRDTYGKEQERGAAAWLVSTLALLPLFIPVLAANVGSPLWSPSAVISPGTALLLVMGLWLTAAVFDLFSHNLPGWTFGVAFVVAGVVTDRLDKSISEPYWLAAALGVLAPIGYIVLIVESFF